MSSIALFFSKFTNEDEIRQKLSSALNLPIVDDAEILGTVCGKKRTTRNKLEQAMHRKTSVFNQFTLERERSVAHLKYALAEKLGQRETGIYCGYTTLLIPHDITHVLKVLVIDNHDLRVQRAVKEGLSEREAVKVIRTEDLNAHGWSAFLYNKEAFDKSLFDIVIPVGVKSGDEVVALINQNYKKTAILETSESLQAINDLALSAEVELALLYKGQKMDVEVRNHRVSIKVNKSAFSFANLTAKLTEIAGSVPGVEGVEVLKGKGYQTSVYRDQHFELPPKVLLVDDEKEYVETLSERLVTRNVGSYAVFDGQEALDFIDGDQPDVMILDLKMPGINGIEVLKQTKKSNPNIEVIILTGHGSETDRETCMNLGAYAYLQKPADIEKLSSTIAEAYKKIDAAREIS